MEVVRNGTSEDGDEMLCIDHFCWINSVPYALSNIVKAFVDPGLGMGSANEKHFLGKAFSSFLSSASSKMKGDKSKQGGGGAQGKSSYFAVFALMLSGIFKPKLPFSHEMLTRAVQLAEYWIYEPYPTSAGGARRLLTIEVQVKGPWQEECTGNYSLLAKTDHNGRVVGVEDLRAAGGGHWFEASRIQPGAMTLRQSIRSPGPRAAGS
eukprot:758403-Hanusia_phi.AAC.3